MHFKKIIFLTLFLGASFTNANPLVANGWAWDTHLNYSTEPNLYHPKESKNSLQSWKCNSFLEIYNSPENNSRY